jgi:dTDP-glucose 4,6-dehydratase/UDP-glucose 4-epimerase
VTKTYCVTGGTGFIGSALVRRLVKDGNSVRLLDNNSRGVTARLGDVEADVEIIAGDVRDSAVVSDAVKGVDSVLHLAYVNGTEFFYSMPELVLDVGVRGMLNVLDACKAHGVPELVLASSSEVYQTPPSTPTDETVPLSIPDVLNPRYSYGGGKIISELLALNYGRKEMERVMIFRPHNVYGPDMGWEHVLPQLVLRAVDIVSRTDAKVIDFPIQGDGSQTRSFIHIDDFTDGVMVMLQGGEHLNIYHIGTLEELSIRAVAEKTVRYFSREPRIVETPLPSGGTPRRCPDIAKLRGIGFNPRISFTRGFPTLADWYIANASRRPINPAK